MLGFKHFLILSKCFTQYAEHDYFSNTLLQTLILKKKFFVNYQPSYDEKSEYT